MKQTVPYKKTSLRQQQELSFHMYKKLENYKRFKPLNTVSYANSGSYNMISKINDYVKHD